MVGGRCGVLAGGAERRLGSIAGVVEQPHQHLDLDERSRE